MKQHRIGFTGGLNKDLSEDKYTSENYVDAMNINIVSGENSSYSVTNEGGTSEAFRLPGKYKLLGYTVLRNYLILLCGDKSVGRKDFISFWKLDISNGITNIAASYGTLSIGGELEENFHKVYEADISLDFSDTNEVKLDVVSEYVSNEKGYIYWTDNANPVKHINIFDTDLENIPASSLDLISNIDLSFMEYSNKEFLNGGSLPAGMIQYGYHLYSEGGNYSNFSPLTGMIQLSSKGLTTTTDSASYYGDAAAVDSGKKTVLNVTGTDPDYDYIRVVGIYYTSFNNIPTIKLIKDTINPKTGILVVEDNGTDYEGTLVAENLIGNNSLFSAKTLAIKDKRLIAGNISESFFDVEDWDARAYRASFESGTTNKMKYVAIDLSNLSNSRTGQFTSSGPTEDWSNFDRDDFFQNRYVIPSDHDAFVAYNGLYDGDSNVDYYNYKWMLQKQDNGSYVRRLGGMGPNVSYWFGVSDIRGRTQLDNVQNESRNTVSIGTYSGSTAFANYVDAPIIYDNFLNYKSNLLSGYFRGYMRDELYRYGIVFIDGKGRRSFTKWIGDIKFPAIYESEYYTVDGESSPRQYGITHKAPSGVISANLLYINFKVENIPIDPLTGNPYKFQIVRVQRGANDKSILSQGFIKSATTTNYGGEDYYVKQYIGGTNDASFVATCNFPELSFDYVNFPDITGNKLDRLGSIRTGTSVAYPNTVAYKSEGLNSVYSTLNVTTPNGTTSKIIDITNFVPLAGDNANGNSFSLENGDLAIQKFLTNPPNGDQGRTGRMGVIETSGVEYQVSDAELVNLKDRNIGAYGGFSYASRQNNSYIPVSTILEGEDTHSVFGGDTFICYFNSLEIINIGNEPGIASDNNQRIFLVPLETVYNIDMNHGGMWPNTLFDSQTSNSDYLYVQAKSFSSNEADYYLYNGAYSSESTVITYPAKPVNFSEQEKIDIQMKISNARLGGESYDPWTNFPINNISEVDSEHGPINKIINWNDKLYFFQDTGFGIQALNERTLSSTETGEQLVLGKGDIIGDYGYISTNHGTMFRDSVGSTDSGLYFVDTLSKSLYRLSNGVEPLSKVKGLSTWFNARMSGNLSNNISQSFLKRDCIIGIDEENNRVLVTVKGYQKCIVNVSRDGYFTLQETFPYRFDLFRVGTRFTKSLEDNTEFEIIRIDNGKVYYKQLTELGFGLPATQYSIYIDTSFTVSFNELLDSFESFHSYIPDIYVSLKNSMIGMYRTSQVSYLHNSTIPGTYYGEPVSSYITALSNIDPIIPKVYTTINYNVETSYLGEDDYSQNLNSIRVYNNYQDTTEIVLSNSNSRRRFREWTFQIPRNRKFNSQRKDARMADYYAKIVFKFSRNKFQKLKNIIVNTN